MANFDELMTTLKQVDEKTERIHFAFGDAKFYRDGSNKFLTVNGENDLLLGENAFKSLCNTLDVPIAYAKRCPSRHQEDTMNFWLSKRGDEVSSVLTNVDSNSVRAFMENGYSYIPAYQVVQSVVAELPGDYELGNYSLSESGLEAQIFSPEFDQDIIDSTVRGGIKLNFSDSWTFAPKVDSYLWRVICTNGMVSNLQSKKFRIAGKSQDELTEQFSQYAALSIQQIPDMFAGFLALEEQKVDNWMAVTRRIMTENSMPRKVSDIVVETAATPDFRSTIRGSIHSMHDVINLLTYVGTHNKKLSDQHKSDLMAIAGDIALHQTHRCDSCGSKVD